MQSITTNQKNNLASATLRLVMPLLLLTVFSATLLAQNATFTGRVTDQTGAVIPKAQITAHNEETDLDTKTTTTKSGDYTIPYLIPGHYSVSAEAAGFKKVNRTNVELQTSQVGTVNFALQVGEVTQSVNVNGDEALLDRGKADRGEVVENERVTEMPLNGRNPVMLDRLNSSVIWNGNLIWMRPFDGQVYTNLNINGSGNYSSEVMLDGVSNQTPRPANGGHTDVAYVAPDDSVQEFKIVTNPYDAEYGNTRGGVIDMTLKSGTNKLHGDVYEYARRTWLDANWWVNDAQKTLNPQNVASGVYNTPQHKMDQYGAEMDGPVVIPKIYNGRGKTFFLMQVENWNEIEPAFADTSVPLTANGGSSPADWAHGDFSALTYNGAPVTIYDPLSTYVDAKGNLNRNPFPGNKIPLNRINPTAQKILSFYPAPNQVGSPGTPWQQNYYVQEPTVDKYRNALIKLDHNFSAKDRFTIRYGYWERYETDTSNGIPGVAGYGELPLGDRNHTFGTQWTHTFTPNLLFDFRGIVAVKAEIAYVAAPGFDSTSLGWPSSLASQLGTFNLFPGMSPSGFTGLGDTGAANGLTTTDSIDLLPTVTWIKGKHTLHMGIDWRLNQYAVPVNAGTDENLSFSALWTQNCWSCAAGNDYGGNDNNSEGKSIASMLLGTGSGGSNNIAPQAFYTSSYYAPFIQDDWKVTPKLTLNLGLRYDLQPFYVDRHNRGDYAFDTTDINPVDAMLPTHTLATGVTFTDKGGLTFLGVNGNPRRAYSTSMYDLQPRAGFAYAVTNKIVVRGGFGEVFQIAGVYPNQDGFSSTTNYVNSLDGGKTPIDNLSDPYPTIVQPAGASLGLLTRVGNGESYINPNFKIPNVWQFSFGIEQQFTHNDTMELSFVGNKAPNNEISQNINHWNGAQEAACNIQMGGRHEVCDSTYSKDPTAIYGQVPNPYKGVAPFIGTSDYSATTIGALQFTEPMPEFGAVTEGQLNNGRSWYNSLQLTLQHRYTDHLTLHGTWTWSKQMQSGGWADNNYLIPSRSVDGSVMPHSVTISVVYDLPWGRGRTFLGNSNRLIDGVLGGWEFASMAIMQSGVELGVPGGWDYVHSAKIKPYWIKPGLVGGGNLQWYAPCYWTTNAETGAITESAEATAFGCSQPDFIQIPSYGANPNITYSGLREANTFLDDSNLSKNFHITKERVKLQLRLETFNTFNHPLFSGGTYNGINQFAGQIGATTGGGQSNKPRYTQVAVKVSW
jgi:hypothetical protein